MTFDDYINLLNADGELRTHLLENQLTDADIQQYVTEHSNVMLGYDLLLKLPLYRARYDSDNWIDKENCSQYSYIQNTESIRMFRYNRDGEQVLYTSTTPFIAFKEIENGSDRNVYISKWGKVHNEDNFSVCTAICSEGIAAVSTAGKYLNIMRNNLRPDTFRQAEEMGNVLEADSIDGYEGLNYRFSSAIASRLFQGCEALLTVSKKSDGKELNITFKREAVDTKLNIRAAYEIDAPSRHNNSILHVNRIGIPQDNQIEWHEWRINMDSFRLPSNHQDQDLAAIRQIIENRNGRRFQFVLFPNINKEIDDFHQGIIVDNETGNRFYVEYEIDLL